jgi:hypothetical protein
MSEYDVFKDTHVKVVSKDGYTTYGDLVEIGHDYLLIKFFDKRKKLDTTAIVKFDSIAKVMSW